MAKETILVVDDEEDILELVSFHLKRDGYPVITAASGEDGLKKVGAGNVSLILLDLMLPGIDGLEVARKLKSEPKTRSIPVIMLTAKAEDADVIAGLELGAEDYVTKPFSPRVLTARVRSVLRGSRAAVPLSDYIRIHELEIDTGRRVCSAGGHRLDLTFTEFQILCLLARRPGWVFSRSKIVDGVRGESYAVTERSVDVQMVSLRKKLGRFAAYIETVRGVGYRFSETPREHAGTLIAA